MSLMLPEIGMFAGILAVVLTGTLLVSRFDTQVRPPRHEDRAANHVLVGVFVFFLFWTPAALALPVIGEQSSLVTVAAYFAAGILAWPVLIFTWNRLEQWNPFGVLEPNPDRYDVFVDMGREEEYPHPSPIRVTAVHQQSTDESKDT